MTGSTEHPGAALDGLVVVAGAHHDVDDARPLTTRLLGSEDRFAASIAGRSQAMRPRPLGFSSRCRTKKVLTWLDLPA